MRNVIIIGLFVVLALFCSSCSFQKTRYAEFKVAPDKTAVMKFYKSGETEIKYDDKILKFCKLAEYYNPIAIIEHNRKLYAIMFDMRAKRAVDEHFDFFEQSGDGFKEINPSEYPKSAAVQNIWAPGQGKQVDGRGNPTTNYMKVEIERNVNDLHFELNYTSHLWYMLEKNVSYYDARGSVAPEFLQSYIDKYTPVHWEFEEMKIISKNEAGF